MVIGPEPSNTGPITPQGGYLAKRCPEAVQLDVLRPLEPLPTSEFIMMLADAGVAFENEVFDSLRSVPGVVEMDRRLPKTDLEELTGSAMLHGARLIIGGRLPVDVLGHRVGEPDLLVRVGDTPKDKGRWSYVPVDVKHHIVLDDGEDGKETVAASLLVPPWVQTGAADSTTSARWIYGDLVQLAHYQRMLEACGHEVLGGRWGGIIGTGHCLAWYNLDAPRWAPSDYLEYPPVGPLSTMDSYDASFTHGLGVIDAAIEHLEDPAVPLLAQPILIDACPECGWRNWCYPKLEETAELSLLPGLNLRKRRLHHEREITNLSDLAALDDRTARLLAGRVSLGDLIRRSATCEPSRLIAEVIPKRRRQIALLAKEGYRTVGDLQEISDQTLLYEDSGMGDLPEQIDRARARLGPHVAYRRRGCDELYVPRADIEIDIDMENVGRGVYLWGALITERHLQRPTVQYLPFVSWDPATEVGELDAFTRFWSWLSAQRSGAASAGRSLYAYCYNKGAENGEMRRIARRLGLEDEVDTFLASDHWVDLYAVFRRQLITGSKAGLKAVAQLAGFHWHVEDPGGGIAMVRYSEAIDDPDLVVQSAARHWLLEYNEDDVRATAALRTWLDGDARRLPSVAEIGAAPRHEAP